MKQPSVETKIKDISTLHHDLVNIMLRNGLTFNKSLEGLDGTGDLHTTATEIESILSTQQAQMRDKIKGLERDMSKAEGEGVVFCDYYNQAIKDVLAILKEECE